MKLDFTIQDPQQRVKYVEELLKENPNPSNTLLEKLADYIIFAQDKEDRKNKKILTENRLVTVNKRETSYEGLISKFENGEDGIYGIMAENKNILLTPKISITPADIEQIPALRLLKEDIATIEAQYAKATGRRKYLLKKQLIEMHQDQYIIKNAEKPPVRTAALTKSINSLDLQETITFDENGEPQSNCIINLFNPIHVSAILCNYSALKEEVAEHFWGDAYYLMLDFDNLCAAALDSTPLLLRIAEYKVDGLQNSQIQALIKEEFDITYTPEYLSALWRKKIPKIIADKAKELYIDWYYTYKEKGSYKKCGRCGQNKLKNNRNFSKNSNSPDGYYSICKSCRNKKGVKKNGG